MPKMEKLTISAPMADYDNLAILLPGLFGFGWEESENAHGDIEIAVYCENRNYLEKARDKVRHEIPAAKFKLESVDIPDPLESWKDFFTPVEIGKRFVILPPWRAEENFGGKYRILINPKSAFGTGHHDSTRLCLSLLDSLLEKGCLRQGDEFLDLGCGTGVLGIAATYAGLVGTGMDNDPLAVENAIENRQLNNVSLKLMAGDETCLEKNKFNLIMANILAQPLIDMAPLLGNALKDNGFLVLSGILKTQEKDVLAAYLRENLDVYEKAYGASNEWSGLALRKRPAP